MNRFRPNFFAVIIIIAIAGISIALPIIFFTQSNKAAMVGEGEDWTPAPSNTASPTFTAIIPATLTDTPQADLVLSDSSTSDEDTTCVYPSVYWEEHPEAWFEMLVGDKTYSVEDIQQIFDDPSQEIFPILIQQLYLANLNIFSGADSTPIQSTLGEANIWIETYSVDSKLSLDVQEILLPIAQKLADFNTGRIGPGYCSAYESFSETRIVLELPPTSTPTPTNTPTSTATSVPTFTPSKTATATKKPTKEPEKPEPPKPTKEPATEVPPPPTDPPPPKPTAEPPKPTVAPPKPTDAPEKPTPTPSS